MTRIYKTVSEDEWVDETSPLFSASDNSSIDTSMAIILNDANASIMTVAVDNISELNKQGTISYNEEQRRTKFLQQTLGYPHDVNGNCNGNGDDNTTGTDSSDDFYDDDNERVQNGYYSNSDYSDDDYQNHDHNTVRKRSTQKWKFYCLPCIELYYTFKKCWKTFLIYFKNIIRKIISKVNGNGNGKHVSISVPISSGMHVPAPAQEIIPVRVPSHTYHIRKPVTRIANKNNQDDL
jgi:hypothetical protein